MLKNARSMQLARGGRRVYFDNTYMYPQNGDPQTEETRFTEGGKERRAQMTSRVLEEMERGAILVVIGARQSFMDRERRRVLPTP